MTTISVARQLTNKVPKVTLVFWVITLLATPVGEIAAHYLTVNLGLGLILTSGIVAVLLVIVLVGQFRLDRYVPAVYWLAIVVISIVGTLIADNLTEKLGVGLITSTLIFSGGLALTFIFWYRVERTLSIRTIVTTRREGYYWLAVLFSFALGTAAGDLISGSLDLGYLVSLLLFLAGTAIVAVAFFFIGMNAIAAFWAAFVLTRPLGASLGDLLSQSVEHGGLGVGTTLTSYLFAAIIVGLVIVLSVRARSSGNPTMVA